MRERKWEDTEGESNDLADLESEFRKRLYGEPDIPVTERTPKGSYIGAPAHFALEMACKQVRAAFAPKREDRFGSIFLVGSALARPDWRDVDIRLILDDESFAELFPSALNEGSATWEFDPRWTLLTVAVSEWMRKQTGLPIDFQVQPMEFANKHHNGPRHAMGLTYVEPRPKDAAADAAEGGV